MLVLSRKPGQALQITDHIRVTIVSVKNHQVKIGIEAPKNLRVIRGEILGELEVHPKDIE